MVNINLAAQQEESPKQEKKEGLLNKGLLGIIAVFILTLAAYGTLLFLQKKFIKDAEAVRSDYNSKLTYFNENDAKEVVDFQNRLSVARGLWVEKKGDFEGVNIREALNRIEKLIIPEEVYLSSLRYDEKTNTLSLIAVANNYNIVAKQILGFKTGEGSDYFSSVSAGKTSYNPNKNIINFDINLKLK